MQNIILKRAVFTHHFSFLYEDRRAIASVSTEDFEISPVYKDRVEPHSLVKVVVETDCGRTYGEDDKEALVPTKDIDGPWLLGQASDKAFDALEQEGDEVVGQHTGRFADAVCWRGRQGLSILMDVTVAGHLAEVEVDIEPTSQDYLDSQCRMRVRLPNGDVKVPPELGEFTIDFDFTDELLLNLVAKAVLSVCEPKEA